MRHADHQLLHTRRTRALQQIIQQRDQRIATFERKARLTDVFGVEIFLQRFSGG